MKKIRKKGGNTKAIPWGRAKKKVLYLEKANNNALSPAAKTVQVWKGRGRGELMRSRKRRMLIPSYTR